MKGFIRFRGFGFPKMCQASAGRLQCIPPRASAGHSVWNTCKFNLRDITEFNSCAWWDNFYIQYVRRELKWFVLIPRYKCKRLIRDISLRAPGRYLTDKSHVIFIGIALAISVSISNYFNHQVRLFPHKWTVPPPPVSYCEVVSRKLSRVLSTLVKPILKPWPNVPISKAKLNLKKSQHGTFGLRSRFSLRTLLEG